MHLGFGYFPDRSCDGAVGGVGTVFIAAIHFYQFAVIYHNFHHAAGIGGAAVAAEKQFFLHLYFLRDAEAHVSQAHTIGRDSLQIVTQQYTTGRDLPRITVSVYINLKRAAVQRSAEA